MPFQSDKQRKYLHANHPEIAKRWERDYAGGGRIGFADGPTPEKFKNDKMYNEMMKWLHEYEQYKKHYKRDKHRREGIEEVAQGGFIPSHEAGIYGLAEGGSITKTPEGQTRGFVQARSDGRRPGYTEDDEDTGGAGHHGGGHGAQSSGGEGGHGVGRHAPTRKNAPDAPPPDDSGDDDKAASYANWNTQEKYTGGEDLEGQREIDKQNALTKLKYDTNLTKDERYGLEVGLGFRKPKQNTLMGNILKGVLTLGTAGAGAGLFGKDIMKVAKVYQKFNQAKQIKTAWDKGKIDLGFKEIDISNIQDKLKSSDQKLMESLPRGHPERIALEAQMTVKAPPTDDKDGSSIKIDDIETVNAVNDEQAQLKKYEDMEMAAYRVMVQQQKDRSKQMAAWQMMMKPYMAAQGGRVPAGYNTGGLSNLFRLKNR